MTTDEAWEKFKLSDSDRIGKSSTAAMLETILAQQNAINAKVDQILDENKGVPAEDMEEESADIPPAPPMGTGAPSPDIGSAPMAGAEGAMPEDAGMNAAETMPPTDESALLGGMPQDLNGGVPESVPDMGGEVPPTGGMSDMDAEPDGSDSESSIESLLGSDQGMAGEMPSFGGSFQDSDYDDNVSAITDAITEADDVDVQLGMTQVLQDYLSKKKGEGDMPIPDMPAPEEKNPLEAIVDAIAGEGADMGEAPVPEDGAGVEELADALAGGAPGLGEMPVGDVLPAEGDEGMADILDAIVGETPEGGSDVPVDAGISEDASTDEEEEPVKKSFGDKDKECDDDEKESEDDDKKESKDDDDKDDKKESKKRYPWDEYLDEEESDSKDNESKDDESDDDKKKESKEEDVPEDEADTVIAIDEEPISDVDIAAIESVVGKKMSDLIVALRDILGDDADTDINPMIAHGTIDLGPGTDPFTACGDSPEAMDKLTRSIDSLIEDRMRGHRGNDGKMYKVVKSEAQLREEKTDKLKRSLSSNAVYHMTGREVLDAMKGLEENGVESVRRSFVNPYDIIVRSLDCAVGQEVTDSFLRSYNLEATQGFAKAKKSWTSEINPTDEGYVSLSDAISKEGDLHDLLNMYLYYLNQLNHLSDTRYTEGKDGRYYLEGSPTDDDEALFKQFEGGGGAARAQSGLPIAVVRRMMDGNLESLKDMSKEDFGKLVRKSYDEYWKDDYAPVLDKILATKYAISAIKDENGEPDIDMDDVPLFMKHWQNIMNTAFDRDTSFLSPDATKVLYNILGYDISNIPGDQKKTAAKAFKDKFLRYVLPDSQYYGANVNMLNGMSSRQYRKKLADAGGDPTKLLEGAKSLVQIPGIYGGNHSPDLSFPLISGGVYGVRRNDPKFLQGAKDEYLKAVGEGNYKPVNTFKDFVYGTGNIFKGDKIDNIKAIKNLSEEDQAKSNDWLNSVVSLYGGKTSSPPKNNTGEADGVTPGEQKEKNDEDDWDIFS